MPCHIIGHTNFAQNGATLNHFDPATLENMELWLTSDDVINTSGKASQLTDISGKNRHATQLTAGYRPAIVSDSLNGHNKLSFTGLHRLVTASFSISQPYTCYLVAKINGTTDGKGLGGTPSAPLCALPYFNATQTAVFAGAAGNGENPTSTALSVFCFTVNGASSKYKRNEIGNITVNSGNNAIATGWEEGGYANSDSYNGNYDFYERIIFSGVHTSFENECMLNYFQHRYNDSFGVDLITFSPKTYHTDIIAGQSNALAQYATLSVLPTELTGVQANRYIWNYTNAVFDKYNAGVNSAGRNYPTGTYSVCWGPEVNMLVNSTFEKSYLIKNVKGGLVISNWASPAGIMWVELKKMVDDYISFCTPRKITPQFRSLLWMQGETDCQGDLSTYQNDLITLITNIRALNTPISNVKIIIAKINSGFTSLTPSKVVTINEIYDYIAANVANVVLIDVNALSLTFADATHYTPESIITISNAWSDLVNG